MDHSMITLSLPGSKSITNRALLLAALSNKTTTLHNVLLSDDTTHMMNALKKCGIRIIRKGSSVNISGKFAITGKKLSFFCGNSGTTLRFLLATLATFKGDFTLTGDARMEERPIKDLVESLRQLGATIEYLKQEGFPPIRITKAIDGGKCTVNGSISSQYLSGIMMAAPLAPNDVHITITGKLISQPYVAMTSALMQQFGVSITRDKSETIVIAKKQRYKGPTNYIIEADASSASYFWGLGVLARTSIVVENIQPQSLQGDVIFKELCEKLSQHTLNEQIDCSDFPDTAMTLALLCAVTPGTWKLTGLESLRVKECDRLAALEAELQKIGVAVTATKSSLSITGKLPSVLIEQNKKRQIHVETYNDHRMAMCFGMLGVILPFIKVKNPACVQKTFPTFWKKLESVSKKIAERNVVLIGMRGSGKSEIGKSLAKILTRTFIDIDHEITKKIKMPIADFVVKKGWPAFRAIEKKVTAVVAKKRNCVISCGGGTVVDSDNATNLRRQGLIVYLRCSLAELTRRLSQSSNAHRPTLTQDGNSITDELSTVFATREPIYSATQDCDFDTSDNTGDMKLDIERKTKSIATLVRTCGIK